MGCAIGLRDDFDGAALRRLSRATKSANQARRLLALAEIYDGGSRTAAARIGGVGLQIVRDWVLRFNADGPVGLATRKPVLSLSKGRLGRKRSSMTGTAARWRRSSRRGRFLPPTASCAGGSSTWPSGCGMSSRCRSASRPSGMNCEPWAIASSRPVRAITGSALKILPLLKSLPHPPGANHPPASERNACRAVVAGRSPCRPADQAHPTLGKAWHPPLCAEGSAPVLGMDLRGDLSR